MQGVDVVPAHGLLHPIRGKKGYLWLLFGRWYRCRSCSCWGAEVLLLLIQPLLDGRIVPEIFLRSIVVAAAVDVVTDTHVVREGNLSRLVDITGKAGLPAALRTSCLAARTVFLKMESVSVHDALFCGFLQMKTAICSLQFLQSCRNFTFPVLRDCKTAKTAGCNKGSSGAVSGWRFIIVFIRFSRFIIYDFLIMPGLGLTQ